MSREVRFVLIVLGTFVVLGAALSGLLFVVIGRYQRTIAEARIERKPAVVSAIAQTIATFAPPPGYRLGAAYDNGYRRWVTVSRPVAGHWFQFDLKRSNLPQLDIETFLTTWTRTEARALNCGAVRSAGSRMRTVQAQPTRFYASTCALGAATERFEAAAITGFTDTFLISAEGDESAWDEGAFARLLASIR